MKLLKIDQIQQLTTNPGVMTTLDTMGSNPMRCQMGSDSIVSSVVHVLPSQLLLPLIVVVVVPNFSHGFVDESQQPAHSVRNSVKLLQEHF